VEVTGVIATDAGILGIWAPASFSDIIDYDSWESALLEEDDIARHVAVGAFVPVSIGGDGAFSVLARVGSDSVPARLSERERQCLFISSEPYLLATVGGAVISGIEHVGAGVSEGMHVPLSAGRWSVTISVIEWDAEPGQKDDAGRPASTALADFTVLLNPEQAAAGEYRTRVRTFDR
jgi:hypothetical protein